MDLTPLQQQALARWNELGTTTPTHPVLQAAYELYYQPFGVLVDALVYDAFASLENPNETTFSLVNPRWSAAKVSKTWSQFNVVEPLIDLAEYLDPIFRPDGTIEEFRLLKDFTFTDENNSMMSTFMESAEHKKLEKFEKEYSEDIFDLADALCASTKIYIDASLELILQDDSPGQKFCQLFIDNPRQFAGAAFQILTQAPQQA